MEKQQDEIFLPVEGNGKKNLVQSAKDFMAGALSPLKGKDLSQMVEGFTSEMTLVAEGLSEDQLRLQQQQDRMDGQLTEAEAQLAQAREEIRELQKQVSALEERLAKAEKEKKEKKLKKTEGFTALIRQATWLAAIIAGAWVIVTIINLFK